MTHAQQEAKAKAMYDGERAKSHNLIDTLEEARSFISRHTEPWYYSGNQLLGQIDSVIAAQWDKEYADYLTGARRQGITNVYSFERYKELARELSAGQHPEQEG